MSWWAFRHAQHPADRPHNQFPACNRPDVANHIRQTELILHKGGSCTLLVHAHVRVVF